MKTIYAMSDIHGCYDAMMNSLKYIHLEPSDVIVFIGDYVDGGSESFKVLKEIMNFEKSYPNQVVVLLGNHDEWLVDWLFSNKEMNDFHALKIGYETVMSFFNEFEIQNIINETKNSDAFSADLVELNNVLHQKIMQSEKYKELLSWLREKTKEKRYFETETQIFVHAGIDEDAEDFWKVGTPDYVFTGKYPATKGKFYKDIISGHVYSEEVACDESYFGSIYWDEKSHYFIDGHTTKSNIVPVLRYDTEISKYSFLNTSNGDWEISFSKSEIMVIGKLVFLNQK
ncbi:metallophosphoesterase [Vagococcus silagei]|uniref:Serine/threonine protein phosphatase n=1 Tax=Vagococcus silagei TaxID=2508885 RepID=A0A4V3TUZ9_9ENTE|nr:metallophosphoesterase [Vagococcus silagei]THB60909.1 serine/threonine protein phosphatase [Vagococcus silagei]